MDIDVMATSVDADPAVQGALAASWQILAAFDAPVRRQNDLSAYFLALNDVLSTVGEAGGTETVEAAMDHVDYLAEKAGCTTAGIMHGEPFAADLRVVLDTLANIGGVLRSTLKQRKALGAGGLGADAIIASIISDPAIQRVLAQSWQTLSDFAVPISESVDLFGYFKSLDGVLRLLNESGRIDAVQTAAAHVEYLADRAGCDSAVIYSGGRFGAEPKVVLDTLVNIRNVLLEALEKPAAGSVDGVPADLVSASAEAAPALRSALAYAWHVLSGWRHVADQPSDLRTYFKSLDDVLNTLNESGQIDAAETATTHVEYLAEKAGCTAAVLLGGGDFTASLKVIVEALANICAALQPASGGRSEQPPEGIPEDVFALILQAEAKLVGWCSREKALVIAGTVLRERPQTCVEIGIFGGRSLIPCAAALRHIGSGAIYGIEAWSPAIAIENATNEGNDEWWSNVDFAHVKRAFYRFVAATNLTQQVRVIEAPSGRASALFDQIDFLHIDGSHSMINAAEDVILYARKVRRGGTIVFDDVNWQSTAPARDLLTALCDEVTVLRDPETGQDVCAVLRRR